MSDFIEALVRDPRVIAVSQIRPWGPGESMVGIFPEEMVRITRALVAAMREPPAEVFAAGWNKMPADQSNEMSDDPPSPLPVWQAMIDEILR